MIDCCIGVDDDHNGKCSACSLPLDEHPIEWQFSLRRVAWIYDVPPWLVDGRYPRPRFSRLRWRLRRIFPLR